MRSFAFTPGLPSRPRAEVGAPLAIARAGGLGQRRAMRIRAREPAEIRALAGLVLVMKKLKEFPCASTDDAAAPSGPEQIQESRSVSLFPFLGSIRHEVRDSIGVRVACVSSVLVH